MPIFHVETEFFSVSVLYILKIYVQTYSGGMYVFPLGVK